MWKTPTNNVWFNNIIARPILGLLGLAALVVFIAVVGWLCLVACWCANNHPVPTVALVIWIIGWCVHAIATNYFGFGSKVDHETPV